MVVGQPEGSQQVLHMRCFEVLEAAVLHKRNAAPRQFNLEPIAVMRSSDQDSLFSQRDALLAKLKHSFAH